LALLEEGAITTSWNGETALSTAFGLTFKAKQDARLSDVLSLNSRYTTAEAYDHAGDLMDVELKFTGNVVNNHFELFQNTQNPFAESTKIGFILPKKADVKLTISDLSGRILKVVEQAGESGYNEVTLDRNELNATGVLYYQLETPTHNATKKMIILD
jgi:hypothetical protein